MRAFITHALWIFLAGWIPVSSFGQDGKLARARDEKKVVVYNTTTVPDMQRIVEGFKKKYSFLEVADDDLLEIYIERAHEVFHEIVRKRPAGVHFFEGHGNSLGLKAADDYRQAA